MGRIKCAITKCQNGALMLYGSNWICGDCFMKVHNKEVNKRNKALQELEDEY